MAGLTLNKPNKFIISFLLISFFSLLALESSEARRMGGGRSFGKMPPIKRQATTPPKPAENVSPKNAPNAAASKRGGMGMLGGFSCWTWSCSFGILSRDWWRINGPSGYSRYLSSLFYCFFELFFQKGWQEWLWLVVRQKGFLKLVSKKVQSIRPG